MRKNFGAQTWLYPMPVLIVGTYDENGSPDAMNAAWGGIHDTAPFRTGAAVRGCRRLSAPGKPRDRSSCPSGTGRQPQDWS